MSLLLLLVSANLQPQIRHLYLTWQRDPCHTITLNLHGRGTPKNLTVHFDTEPHHSRLSAYAHKVSGDGKQGLYHIELTGLDAGRDYFFTVSDGKQPLTFERKFRTIPEEGALRFVEGGDWENTEEACLVAQRAASFSPHAALLGGDYPSHVWSRRHAPKWDQWLDTYEEAMVTPEGHTIPMVMAVGNHEVTGGFGKTQADALFFFDYFKQGEKSYFSLPFGKDVTVLVLDSGHAASHDGEQKIWLEKALREAGPVCMAVYHVPLFPSLRFVEKNLLYASVHKVTRWLKGSAAASKLYSPYSRLGREHWLPLFKEHGLTVAFEHHDQALKRTKEMNGTLFLGDGGWGAKHLYPPIQGKIKNYFAKVQGGQHFFWLVDIEREAILYRAINISGKELDRVQQAR